MTLFELARSLRLHRHTIARIIGQTTGLSFRQWKDKIRRDLAVHLLASDRPIKEVSYLLGFDTTRSFDKFARRVLGMTPTDFRASKRQQGHLDHSLANRTTDST